MCVTFCVCGVVFFKQKTAYEMRISDWSSDVCSSDLVAMDISGLPTRTWLDPLLADADFAFFAEWMDMTHPDISTVEVPEFPEDVTMRRADEDEIGRASCRDRVCQYV